MTDDLLKEKPLQTIRPVRYDVCNPTTINAFIIRQTRGIGQYIQVGQNEHLSGVLTL